MVRLNTTINKGETLMQTINQLFMLYKLIISILESVGTWLPQLVIRFLLAWEFGEAGWAKLHGSNWFADLSFPFPFNLIPASWSWNIALSFELVGAVALILGLFTRFFSVSLIILTIVAIASVHWPEQWHTLSELLQGYRIEDTEGDGLGNYKLPLIYLVMFLPLLFNGAGRFSLDACIKDRIN